MPAVCVYNCVLMYNVPYKGGSYSHNMASRVQRHSLPRRVLVKCECIYCTIRSAIEPSSWSIKGFIVLFVPFDTPTHCAYMYRGL